MCKAQVNIMKNVTFQAVLIVSALSFSAGANACENEFKPAPTEQELINGWADGLIDRCHKYMEKKPQNKACLDEIMKQGYRLRTRDYWAKRGFLDAKK